MNSLTALLVLCVALAGCQPKTTTHEAAAPELAINASAADVMTGCNVHVEKIWIDQETPLRRYTAEADTLGPTCQQAVAVLIVRAREGSPIFTWSSNVTDLFGLMDATDPAAMKTALGDWIDQSGAMYPTTDKLPEWPAEADSPTSGEFPFLPDEGIDRVAWNDIRKGKFDMFCFVQGRESLDCTYLRDGWLESLGVQTFPG
jgi:hypothetical protein